MEALLKLVANTATYVIGYVVLMAPTYFLPYMGSNSLLLNAAASAASGKVYALFLVHLGFLAALVALAWARGKLTGKTWLIGMPLAAAMFDMVPGLSLIPLAPTVFHMVAIIVGIKDDRKAALSSQ